MKRFRSWLVVGACALLNGAACNWVGHSCTLIGCADAVSVRILQPDAAWQAGAYQLELTLDDVAGTCDFSIPEDLPERGSVASFTCIDGVNVSIQQLAECTTLHEGGAVSQSCDPIPDQYELNISAFGEPTHLTLVLTRDGEQLLSEDRELTYTESRPNGPDCEPVCRQALVDLTI